MKITFRGAAETVTGSCHLVHSGGRRPGLFQGPKRLRALTDAATNPSAPLVAFALGCSACSTRTPRRPTAPRPAAQIDSVRRSRVPQPRQNGAMDPISSPGDP